MKLKFLRTPAIVIPFLLLAVVSMAPVSAQDLIGPRVANHSPAVVASDGGPLSQITLNFDEAVDPASFSGEDVILYGPMGGLIPVTVSVVENSGDTEFTLSFAEQTQRGTYRVTVGPEVADLAGNPMNQDEDAFNGERGDAYQGTVVLEATTAPLGAAPVLFSEDFESWPPPPDYWSFTTASSGTLRTVTSDSPHEGSRHLRFGPPTPYNSSPRQWAVLKLDLSSQSDADDLVLDFWLQRTGGASDIYFRLEVSGDGQTWQKIHEGAPISENTHYSVDLDAELAAAFVDLDAEVHIRFWYYGFRTPQALFLDQVRVLKEVDTFGPRITAHSPAVVASDGGPLSQITLNFDEAVDPASFSGEDVTLYGPMGSLIPVTVRAVENSGNTEFTLSFAEQTQRGTYRLNVGPEVADSSGNLLNQDEDAINGESGDGYEGIVFLHPIVPVLGAAPVLFIEDFESWDSAPTSWYFFTEFDGTLQTVTTDGPHGGSQHLRFDSLAGGAQGWATLKLDLSAHAGAEDLSLDFWLRTATCGRLSVEVHGGHGWRQLITNSSPSDYQHYAFDLRAELWASAIELDPHVYIRFRLEGDFGRCGQTVYLDDLRILRGGDPFGPKVTDHTPEAVAGDGGPLSQITVTFDEAIDPGSFTAEDVVLRGPSGGSIPVTVSVVAESGDTEFTLSFAEQTQRGSYRLAVGPAVTDTAGNAMNQNDNIINGDGADAFNGIVVFEATTPALDAAPILFSEDFESWSPVPDHWSFTTVLDGTIQPVTSEDPFAGSQHLRFESLRSEDSRWATLKLDLSGQTGAEDLFLDFWARRSGGGGCPGTFYLEISGDGETWHQVFAGVPPAAYSNYVFDLDAELADGTIEPDSDVHIRFRYQGSRYCDQTIFLDQVRITRGEPTLQLAIVPASFPENAGPAGAHAVVTRMNTTDLSELTVAVSGPAESVLLPETITIPATLTRASFFIGGMDDGVAAGSRDAEITVSAAGFVGEMGTVTVLEATPAQIGLTLDETSVSEGASADALSGTVTRDRGLDTDLIVTLNSSDPTELYSSSVTIPIGSTTAGFTISTPNDGDLDGTQTVTITAEAPDFESSELTVDVIDDDTATERTIGGSLFGTLAASEYTTTTNILVSTGQTLLVEPGCTLRFGPGHGLTITGTLTADATGEYPVVFTSKGEAVRWKGIIVNGTRQLSTFRGCQIERAEVGISIVSHLPMIEVHDSVVRDCAIAGIQSLAAGSQEQRAGDIIITESLLMNNRIGIHVRASASPRVQRSPFGGSGPSPSSGLTIKRCRIAENEIGIRMEATTGTGSCVGGACWIFYGHNRVSGLVDSTEIVQNRVGVSISSNKSGGIQNATTAFPTVTNCLVAHNSEKGIEMTAGASATLRPIVRNNTVAHNGIGGITHSIHTNDGLVIENNIVAFNGAGMAGLGNYNEAFGTIAHNNVFGNGDSDWAGYPVEFGETGHTRNRTGLSADRFMNVSVDPQFVSQSDLHILASSPIRDGGAISEAPREDIDGELRDSLPDLGYDESTAGPVLTFGAWATEWFGGDLPGTGPLDDFDGNGVSNLLAFISGANPLAGEWSPVTGVKLVNENGQRFLAMQYRRSRTAAPTELFFSTSTDLQHWSRRELAQRIIAEDPDAWTMEALLPIDDATPHEFLRLEVSPW